MAQFISDICPELKELIPYLFRLLPVAPVEQFDCAIALRIMSTNLSTPCQHNIQGTAAFMFSNIFALAFGVLTSAIILRYHVRMQQNCCV